jgi:4-aminobutyrate aminotransferase/(S)-3-amino-2-methylpropionate transaminase
LELVRPGTDREPAKEETERLLRYCLDHGLILISAGTYGNVVRLLMPLVTTDEQFDEGLNILEGALTTVSESLTAASRLA